MVGIEKGQQARALLQGAVDAIDSGRWDDLTHLLRRNAATLQAAKIRLERKALEKYANGRAAKVGFDDGIGGAEQQAKLAADECNGTKPFAGAVAASTPPMRGPVALAGGIAEACMRWADRSPWQAILLVQLLVIVAYAPGLWYEGYKMDDAVAIERNPNVVADRVPIEEMMRRDFWGLPMHGSGWTNKSFRPLTTWSFRLNYLLHGLESSGFFIANIVLHVLSSILVGRSAVAYVGLPGSCAAFAALLFGVHPVHTENVLYLVGRADVLAAIFGALALNSYSTLYCPPPPLNRDWAHEVDAHTPKPWASWSVWLVFPVTLVVASGLCKESGFMLFALFLLMELLDFIDSYRAIANMSPKNSARHWRAQRWRIGIVVAATLLVFVLRYRHTGGTSLNMSPQDNPISFEASRMVRILSYAYLHGVYMKLLVWPQFLCYDYSMDAIPAVRTMLDVRLLLPLAAYVAIFGVVASAFCMPRRYRRAALLSLALLVVTFFPASNILFPVGTVIGERLLYGPSEGFCLAVLVWIHRAVVGRSGSMAKAVRATDDGFAALSPTTTNAVHGSSKKATRATSRERRRAAAAAIMAGVTSQPPRMTPAAMRRLLVANFAGGGVAILLMVRCLMRVRVWESSESLYMNDGLIQPTSSKVQFNLGIIHMQNQEWDLAVAALLRCAWADPLSSLPFYRIGQIEILRGRYDTAEQYLSAALDKFGASLMVRDEEVFHDLAVAMFQNGKVEAAETRLRVALQINPDFAKGWNNLACCLIQRSLHDATRALRKAVTLAPENPQYWANLALLAQHSGDPATSSGAWRRAQELWPGMPDPSDCTWEFAPAG